MRSRACWSEMRRAGVLVIAAALGCGSGGDEDDDAIATDVGTDTAPTTSAPTTTAPSTDADSSDTTPSGSDDATSLDPPECIAPEVACGQVCADVDSDPTNCGQCGISCVIDNASATCTAGACAMAACDAGYADCDGAIATGCEHVIDCDAGAACSTSCGSTGVVGCSDPCAATCAAPAEVCNYLDDDCDTMCDASPGSGPIPGCRVGVHRANGGIGHFYTTNAGEVAAAGLTMESENFFFVYPEPHDGLIPLFRCIKPNTGGRRFLTSSIDCEATGAPELTLGFISPDADCASIPLYRVWAAASNDHFYTTSLAERDNAIAMFGYVDQGTPGSVFIGL
jgi:hypothetical protein